MTEQPHLLNTRHTTRQVWAVAYDNPIPGYNTPTTSNLRLWDALPLEEFDLAAFNAGEYDKVRARGVRPRMQTFDFVWNWCCESV